MLNSKATDIVAAAESRYQQRLAVKQEKIRKRATTVQPPSSTLLWAAQLEPTLVKTIQQCMSAPEQAAFREALAQTLPLAVRVQEQVITNPDSTVAERVRASNTLLWVGSMCTRTQVRLARAAAAQETAISRRAKANAEKVVAERDLQRHEVETKKAKLRIAKTLQAAREELGITPPGFELPEGVDPKSKQAKLLARQFEARQRNS